MLETATEIAKANPVLLAGVGTVAFGTAMYFVRGIPVWIFGVLRRLLTIEITLTSDSVLYHEILEVLSKSRIGALARSYATDANGEFVSGFGTSISVFGRRLIAFNRELIEKNYRLDEKLHVTIFGRDIRVLGQIIAKARQPRVDNDVKVYSASHSGGYWHPPVRRRKRGLGTVFVNGHAKAKIVERIEWFMANEQWYLLRGIPYKLTFLLHGPPGTGKSSLIYALASHFGRGIGTISSITGIDDTLRCLPENAFAAIEDIDMISASRDAKQDAPALGSSAPAPAALPPPRPANDAAVAERQLNALQILINTMDGFSTPHGLIMFVTTNHKNKLDAALVRSSRIDHDVEVGPLDANAAEAMFVAFYGEDGRSLIRPVVSAEDFELRTGAELQAMFMTADAAEACARLAAGHRGNVVSIRGA